MVGPRTWINGIITLTGLKRNIGDKFLVYTLSPIQETRLKGLQERVHIPFDQTRPDHQEALKSLWHASFPNIHLQGLISEQWKDMGWQGTNPSTDFRGCGFISLENLLFFATNYPDSYRRVLLKEDGMRATWEYPFAVAGINITFMLIQLLDLPSVKPRTIPGITFLKLLKEDEEAFDILFCVAFVMLDAQWLAMHASYMEFNDVLRVTRAQLAREFSLEDVHRIYDLPALSMDERRVIEKKGSSEEVGLTTNPIPRDSGVNISRGDRFSSSNGVDFNTTTTDELEEDAPQVTKVSM